KDPDLVTHIGHLYRVCGAKRQRIRATKKSTDVGVALQHILRDRKALILHPHFARLFGDYLNVRRFCQRFVKALVAVQLWRGPKLTLDDGYVGFASGDFGNVLAKSACGTDAIGGDERIARGVRSITVDVDNRNISFFGRSYRNPGSSGARW